MGRSDLLGCAVSGHSLAGAMAGLCGMAVICSSFRSDAKIRGGLKFAGQLADAQVETMALPPGGTMKINPTTEPLRTDRVTAAPDARTAATRTNEPVAEAERVQLSNLASRLNQLEAQFGSSDFDAKKGRRGSQRNRRRTFQGQRRRSGRPAAELGGRTAWPQVGRANERRCLARRPRPLPARGK